MKAKRKPGNRFKLYTLLFSVIFVLGFGLGIIVFNALRMEEPSPIQLQVGVDYGESSTNPTGCAPIQRIYEVPDQIPIEEMTQVALNSYPHSTPTVSLTPLSTGTLVPNFGNAGGPQGTPSPGQAGMIVPTSVASMNATGQAANFALTATAIAHYLTSPTPFMPSANQTSSFSGTPVAIVHTGGGGIPSTMSPPIAIDTSLHNPLNAGEIDDNAEWDVYMTYRRNFLSSLGNSSPVDDVDVTNRQIIRVVDTAGKPVLGAKVDVLLQDGRQLHTSCTYATGYTLFFPNIHTEEVDTFRVVVSKNGVTAEAMFVLSDQEWIVELDVEQATPKLDVLFLIDATGSMDDEIAQLTNNILFISEQIDEMPDEVDVRYGLVSYKDWQYPTQVWDFTHDVHDFQSSLAQLWTAGGDGETLNDGLDKSLHAVQWRGDETIKLIFLIGDEPPGVYENQPSYANSMLLANHYGVKVHPIASSGLDVQGEYIFRQIAQTTMGHFIFLTYEDGKPGIPGAERPDLNVGEPGDGDESGEYTVEQLDDIVLNLIREEVAALSGD